MREASKQRLAAGAASVVPQTTDAKWSCGSCECGNPETASLSTHARYA